MVKVIFLQFWNILPKSGMHVFLESCLNSELSLSIISEPISTSMVAKKSFHVLIVDSCTDMVLELLELRR